MPWMKLRDANVMQSRSQGSDWMRRKFEPMEENCSEDFEFPQYEKIPTQILKQTSTKFSILDA